MTMFLVNLKDLNSKLIVANIIHKLKNLGCLISFKVHFLHNYLAFFSILGRCERNAKGMVPLKHKEDEETLPEAVK